MPRATARPPRVTVAYITTVALSAVTKWAIALPRPGDFSAAQHLLGDEPDDARVALQPGELDVGELLRCFEAGKNRRVEHMAVGVAVVLAKQRRSPAGALVPLMVVGRSSQVVSSLELGMRLKRRSAAAFLLFIYPPACHREGVSVSWSSRRIGAPAWMVHRRLQSTSRIARRVVHQAG